MRTSQQLSAAFAFLLLVSQVPAAPVPAISFDAADVTGTFRDGNDRVVGWEFTVGAQAINVTGLGFYDVGANGLLDLHDVGIYRLDGSESLVLSGTVASGTGADLRGGFRYVDVSSTQLDAHASYVIAASLPGTGSGNGDLWLWDPVTDPPGLPLIGVPSEAITVDSSIDLGLPGSARFKFGTAALEFPDQVIADVDPTDPRRTFIGPSFEIEMSIVPLPAAAWLFLTSIGALGALARAQRKAKLIA
jgi:hypothetical protein